MKTMSVIDASINCPKELVEFSALIPQYLKFYYVISERNAKTKQNGGENFFFRETIFPFRWKPYLFLA